jgi:hypothetical protein
MKLFTDMHRQLWLIDESQTMFKVRNQQDFVKAFPAKLYPGVYVDEPEIRYMIFSDRTCVVSMPFTAFSKLSMFDNLEVSWARFKSTVRLIRMSPCKSSWLDRYRTHKPFQIAVDSLFAALSGFILLAVIALAILFFTIIF